MNRTELISIFREAYKAPKSNFGGFSFKFLPKTHNSHPGVFENPQKHKDRTGPRRAKSTFGQIHVEVENLGIRSQIQNGNFRQCPESIRENEE